MRVDPFLSKVGKICEFSVHLAVVLGGLISLAWLAGSLLLYWKLDRPAWELASLVAVSLFVFSWFCVREFSRRSLRAGAGKPQDDDSWGEDREELEDHVQACTDKRKHAAHKAAVQAAEAKKGRKEEKEEAQAEAQNLATWQFLGGDDSHAWLLTDTQVKQQC